MLIFLIILFSIYTLYKAILSVLEINFTKNALKNEPVVLDAANYQKAGLAKITNEKFSLFSDAYAFVIFIFWVIFGLQILGKFFDENSLFSQTLFVLSYLIIGILLALPLSIYEKFVKDKKLGFSNLTARTFALDTLKTLILTFIFGGVVVFLLLACFKYLGNFWWIYGFILSFLIILIVNLIYPTLIAPIFNKMTPLENSDLKDEIEKELKSVGLKSNGVFVIDASKRDKRLNAYFGGLGSSKRVVLFDTLINALSKDEILAVLGHELGHFKHKDILKNIAVMFFVLFALFAVFGNIPNSVFEALKIPQNGASTLLILLIFSPILSAFFEPIISALSRAHEFGADKFGASIKSKTDMISALKKLGSENKAFPISHPLYSAVYHSHPSLYERIKELENED